MSAGLPLRERWHRAWAALAARSAGAAVCRRGLQAEAGQASLEYLVVGVVLIAMIAAMGALWRYAAGGGFAQLAASAGSHVLDDVGGVADALLF